MSVLNIVHISPTPLVGSPGKIAWAQKNSGHQSIAVALNDYPQAGPLSKKFLDRTLTIDAFTKDYIENEIAKADILHIHNYLPSGKADWLKNLNQSAKYVYHVHSPLREGPLYTSRAEVDDIDFDVRLVVGQHWGRFYPDYVPVPNIILSPSTIRLRNYGEKLRVMFSPTHKHPGRWTSKHSDALTSVLSDLERLGKIEVISPQIPVLPETLMDVRRSCHVTIDEITTGGFHMVSLEGMCAGNIVINRADYFSKATFASFCQGEMPPFQYADDSCIADVLFSYANDVDLTNFKQLEAYNYYRKNCCPTKLVEKINENY